MKYVIPLDRLSKNKIPFLSYCLAPIAATAAVLLLENKLQHHHNNINNSSQPSYNACCLYA